MIGIDIVEIERFESLTKSNFSLWNKVFTEKEWQYCFGKPTPSQHLAGIFAAKEAVMKAVGDAIMKNYNAIEIQHEKSGKPIASLTTSEKQNVAISISHNKTVAVAVALVS